MLETSPEEKTVPFSTAMILCGFFLALAVILGVGGYYIGKLQTEKTALANRIVPTPVVEETAQTASQTLIATVEYRGGMCPDGQPCGSKYEILTNEVINKDGEPYQQLQVEQVEELLATISEADFEQIQAVPFEGECPVNYDGQETIYTLYTADEVVAILPSCTYALDDTIPLIALLNTLIGQ